ncbi:MAG: cytochrome c [Chromatiales bacterium]|nr:cytochrome c [Chromatiales bacterium]
MKKILIAAAAVALAGAMGSAVAGDAAAGKAKSATCAGCHGPQGVSMVPTYPNLAGQKEAYLAKAIRDYKSGTRTDATMKAMTAALSDADVDNLAAYYASLSCK